MHAIVLKYLEEVARRGSIRKASRALNVASSAINRQILKLEEELGTPLFQRLPAGMRLTPAGEPPTFTVGRPRASRSRIADLADAETANR